MPQGHASSVGLLQATAARVRGIVRPKVRPAVHSEKDAVPVRKQGVSFSNPKSQKTESIREYNHSVKKVKPRGLLPRLGVLLLKTKGL